MGVEKGNTFWGSTFWTGTVFKLIQFTFNQFDYRLLCIAYMGNWQITIVVYTKSSILSEKSVKKYTDDNTQYQSGTTRAEDFVIFSIRFPFSVFVVKNRSKPFKTIRSKRFRFLKMKSFRYFPLTENGNGKILSSGPVIHWLIFSDSFTL